MSPASFISHLPAPPTEAMKFVTAVGGTQGYSVDHVIVCVPYIGKHVGSLNTDQMFVQGYPTEWTNFSTIASVPASPCSSEPRLDTSCLVGI